MGRTPRRQRSTARLAYGAGRVLEGTCRMCGTVHIYQEVLVMGRAPARAGGQRSGFLWEQGRRHEAGEKAGDGEWSFPANLVAQLAAAGVRIILKPELLSRRVKQRRRCCTSFLSAVTFSRASASLCCHVEVSSSPSTARARRCPNFPRASRFLKAACARASNPAPPSRRVTSRAEQTYLNHTSAHDHEASALSARHSTHIASSFSLQVEPHLLCPALKMSMSIEELDATVRAFYEGRGDTVCAPTHVALSPTQLR